MSNSERRPPKLRIAPAVRPHHGNTFVEEWFRHSWESGSLTDAFGDTHVMEWPANAGKGGNETPEETRYKTIENEIIERALETVKAAIGEAFVRVAADVLERERRRQ